MQKDHLCSLCFSVLYLMMFLVFFSGNFVTLYKRIIYVVLAFLYQLLLLFEDGVFRTSCKVSFVLTDKIKRSFLLCWNLDNAILF